jgi:hypothetical protein
MIELLRTVDPELARSGLGAREMVTSDRRRGIDSPQGAYKIAPASL